MHLLRCKPTQVFIIILVPYLELFAYQACILIFEYLLEHALHFISLFVVALIFGDLVDEEERQTLDTPLEQLAFLLKMRHDGFPYLHALHGLLVRVSDYLTSPQRDAIQECNITFGVDFRQGKPFIFGQSRFFSQTVSSTESFCFSHYGARCRFRFDFNASHRRPFG